MWLKDDELWADVALDPGLHAEANRYYLHPALLDGVFQCALQATPRDEERDAMFLPIRIERVEWRRRAGAAVRCHVRNVHNQDVRWFADLIVFTPAGEWVATLTGCSCVKRPQELHFARCETKAYQEAWVPAPPREPAAAPALSGAWLVVDPSRTAGQLVRLLGSAGAGEAGCVRHLTKGQDLLPELPVHADARSSVVVWLVGSSAEEPWRASFRLY